MNGINYITDFKIQYVPTDWSANSKLFMGTTLLGSSPSYVQMTPYVNVTTDNIGYVYIASSKNSNFSGFKGYVTVQYTKTS